MKSQPQKLVLSYPSAPARCSGSRVSTHTMSNNDLDPIDPRTVLQMYLQSRRSELADSSLEAHRRRLNLFCEWCETENIGNEGCYEF